MASVESIPFVRSPKIDRTGVRPANRCSWQDYTKRIVAHARLVWPEDTEHQWADAAGCGLRNVQQHWTAEEPTRCVSGDGVAAVIIGMLGRG